MPLFETERFEPTDEQRRVIEHRGSHALVFAGPGTGKTETLARRFASIVHDDGVAADAILVLTFSRRAALGMRKRIVQRMRERAGGSIAVPELHVYTFHGFCRRLLDGDGPRGARRGLLTPVKERLIWNRLTAGISLDTFAEDVIRSSAFATAVLNLIARLKGDGVSAARFAAEAGDDQRLRDLAKLYTLKDAERTRLGLADFRDLVADAVQALGQPRSAARAWLQRRRPFRHVLVDEFQDSDPMQVRLLEAFGGAGLTSRPPSPEMCFVGDFNQSIYRFRGAAPENIVDAKTRFRCEELTLRLNRRSVQRVLDVANQTPYLRPESITQADPANEKPGSVRMVQVETADDEVDLIADAIADRLRAGTKPSDIAVLLRVVEPYRSTIARELQARGIPVAAQSSAGFHEDALVSAVLSGIKAIAGDDDVDAWRHLLTNPLVGFRPLTVSFALGSGSGSPRRAFDARPPSGRWTWQTFIERFDAASKAGGPAYRFDPAALIEALVRELDLLWPIREAADVPAFDPSASPARLAALLQAAHDIREVPPAAGRHRLDAASFVSALSELLPLLGDQSEGPRADEAGVPVMSIHGAKGLEFDMVVIPQLLDGVLPTRTRPDALFGSRPSPYVRSSEDNAVEEASLWYVALTRARCHVLATAARLGDEADEQPLSAFAYQIPDRDRVDSVAGRDEHVGFAGAYEAATLEERASRPVRRYLEQRPVLQAFLASDGLVDQAGSPLHWPLQRLSPSGIETFVTCPRRWFYKHPLQLSSDDPDTTRMGRFVHAVLERYHNEVKDFPGPAGSEHTAQSIIDALAPITLEEARGAAGAAGLTTEAPLFRYETGRVMGQLTAYARWLVDESRARPFTVLACEQRISVPLGGIVLIGHVDRVDRLADGTLAIRDYKTGKIRTKGSAAVLHDVQRRFEAEAAGAGFFADAPEGLKLQTYLYVRGVEALFGARVSRADYLYLAGSSKDRDELFADTTVFGAAAGAGGLAPEDLDFVYEGIAGGVVREVSGGSVSSFATVMQENVCRFCAFTMICPGPGSITYVAMDVGRRAQLGDGIEA